jgi:hypothetical protein
MTGVIDIINSYNKNRIYQNIIGCDYEYNLIELSELSEKNYLNLSI